MDMFLWTSLMIDCFAECQMVFNIGFRKLKMIFIIIKCKYTKSWIPVHWHTYQHNWCKRMAPGGFGNISSGNPNFFPLRGERNLIYHDIVACLGVKDVWILPKKVDHFIDQNGMFGIQMRTGNCQFVWLIRTCWLKTAVFRRRELFTFRQSLIMCTHTYYHSNTKLNSDYPWVKHKAVFCKQHPFNYDNWKYNAPNITMYSSIFQW